MLTSQTKYTLFIICGLSVLSVTSILLVIFAKIAPCAPSVFVPHFKVSLHNYQTTPNMDSTLNYLASGLGNMTDSVSEMEIKEALHSLFDNRTEYIIGARGYAKITEKGKTLHPLENAREVPFILFHELEHYYPNSTLGSDYCRYLASPSTDKRPYSLVMKKLAKAGSLAPVSDPVAMMEIAERMVAVVFWISTGMAVLRKKERKLQTALCNLAGVFGLLALLFSILDLKTEHISVSKFRDIQELFGLALVRNISWKTAGNIMNVLVVTIDAVNLCLGLLVLVLLEVSACEN